MDAHAMSEEGAIGKGPAAGPAADESALIRGLQRGDRSCFERLYRQHTGRVYATCLRLTRKPGEAEELTQEVFVRAWQHRSTFHDGPHLRAWLTRLIWLRWIG